MKTLKKIFKAVNRLALSGGLIIASLILLGTLAEIFTGKTLLEGFSVHQKVAFAASLFVIFVVLILVRYEHTTEQLSDYFGNEYSQKLWFEEKIFPDVHSYFQYVRNGRFDIVHTFWLAGFAGSIDSYGNSDLHVASESGQAAMVEELLKRGGDLTKLQLHGMNALMLAAAHKHPAVVKTILRFNPPINAPMADGGMTALHLAAHHGRDDIVRMLLAEGAKTDLNDQQGLTPFLIAIASGKFDVARTLLEAGSTPDRRDIVGASALDYALATQAPADFLHILGERGVGRAEPRLKSEGSSSSYPGKVKFKWQEEHTASANDGSVD
jgi:hypothetical protein